MTLKLFLVVLIFISAAYGEFLLTFGPLFYPNMRVRWLHAKFSSSEEYGISS